MMVRFIFLLFFFCFILPASAQENDVPPNVFQATALQFERLGDHLRQCAEKAAPAVVNICVTRQRPRSRPTETSIESGSGIVAVIAQKQVILTNRHIIANVADEKALQIMTHDRKILTPSKISSNEDFDIAVIEFDETLPDSATIGDSSGVRVGNLVLAVGNPFGLDRSVSMGVISAVERRHIPGTSGFVPRVGFFQTDAAVNPGSSGGMLINLRGEVIGILTAIATQGGGNEGIAFVMPIHVALRVAEQLLQTGSVVKPYAGLGFDSTFSWEEHQSLGLDRLIGAKIRTVAPDSPAENAGLQTNDVVLQIGTVEVEDDLHAVHIIAQSAIGKPLVIHVHRKGTLLPITITLTEQLSH